MKGTLQDERFATISPRLAEESQGLPERLEGDVPPSLFLSLSSIFWPSESA